jgi:hypothetical protein
LEERIGVLAAGLEGPRVDSGETNVGHLLPALATLEAAFEGPEEGEGNIDRRILQRVLFLEFGLCEVDLAVTILTCCSVRGSNSTKLGPEAFCCIRDVWKSS